MAQVLLGLELAEIQAFLGHGQPAYRAKQLFNAIYRQCNEQLNSVSTLPLTLRQDLEGRCVIGLPSLDRRYDSADGTRRYLLRLEDSRTVEAVLMPEEGRDTICISTQVGCPVNCKFCMTALMGLE